MKYTKQLTLAMLALTILVGGISAQAAATSTTDGAKMEKPALKKVVKKTIVKKHKKAVAPTHKVVPVQKPVVKTN